MEEKPNRYRASRVPERRVHPTREQYQRLQDRKTAEQRNREFTYDDFIKSVKDSDKIIDLEDTSRWVEFKEAVAEFREIVSSWLKRLVKSVFHSAKKKSVTVYSTKLANKPFMSRITDRVGQLFSPFTKRFGAKPTLIAVGTSITVLVLLGWLFNPFDSSDSKGVATGAENGAVQGASSEPVINDLPEVKAGEYEFELLFPDQTSATDFKIVRISPTGAEPAYTFLDTISAADNIQITVTQQEVPVAFNLEEVAKNFQATNLIQVDETTVYHGYSEAGGVQSLLFVKNDLLISIRSPRVLTDDIWAAYVASY